MQYSNEELAVKIQAGQAGYMPMLWEQVQAFVRLQAARWLRAWQSSRPILEFDDLYQCGYPAMCEAVKTYQADKNMTFIGWLSNYLHTEFSREVGCRTQKQRQDPLANSISLDAPLGGETEDMTLGDTVADQKDQYAAAEADMYNKQLQEIVGEAVDNLPQREQKVLHLRYWEDMTLRRAGECIGVGPERVRQIENKALRTLRKGSASASLREAWYGSRNLYTGTSLHAWEQSGCSVQEREIIRREEAELRRVCRRRANVNTREDLVSYYVEELGFERWRAEQMFPA